ncbi:HNH endonuclease [Pseudomonas jessenii]|uniref:HNH endonuclease n=3 Tax=Pseudomonas TaxID=286 RepID=A0A5C4L294_PSEJE|nr:HNH endonuclease [Pseudomonas fluorescens]TNB98592.1 HNH endonuclease [Pseudomonas jessenii]
MRHCIYCRTDKDDSEFTIEHVIPQFLGGAYAPDFLKTRDVCGRCNSNLGLFVDASFEKNWMVSNWLRQSSLTFYDPDKPVGVSLICMGNCDLSPPQTPDGYVCEAWLGPHGEQVYWIRPHDERMYAYVGGNPRTVKQVKTRAYFMFSERTHKDPRSTLLCFEQAFQGRKVKKILCGELGGANLADFGFSTPDDLDRQRIEYFQTECEGVQKRNIGLSVDVQFDRRFLPKLAIGIAYCLFGAKVLDTDYGKELHKGLWHQKGGEVAMVRGQSLFSAVGNKTFNSIVGFPNAVVFLILMSPEGVAINLNINEQLNWTVMCAPREILTAEDVAKIGEGQIVLLVRALQKGVHTDLPSYLAHKGGILPIAELEEIEKRAGKITR